MSGSICQSKLELGEDIVGLVSPRRKPKPGALRCVFATLDFIYVLVSKHIGIKTKHYWDTVVLCSINKYR